MKRFFCFMKKLFKCDNEGYHINVSKVKELGNTIVKNELAL